MATLAPLAPPRAQHALDEDDQPRATWERAIGWFVIVVCTLTVFYIIDPHLRLWPFWRLHFGDVFKNTTTNGGDMGAHVWWPWFLEHHWFSWNPFQMRLSGWAPDWYAGFPAGQYYFPVPALMVAFLDQFMHYNVAFKLVTISGPMMLPGAAYYFARGIKAPWPAPPAFAFAALGTLVQTRTDWQIYGGNIASTLAGEFSFTIGLAFALFGLGALARTLDDGEKPWLPALFIALAMMSHIVVALFIMLAAVLLWLTRRPQRTWRIAIPVGVVAGLLTSVWLLPLLAQQAYTQSMRYTKLLPQPSKNFKLWSWLPLPSPVRHTVNSFVDALGRPRLDTNVTPPKHLSPTLWLPWWIWVLAAVAIVAAGWYRRRSTLVLLVLALVIGVMFIEWPEHAIWNTRFLPFWMLCWAFIAAMGATEILRLVAKAIAWAYRWIRDGDLQDARARAWAELATAEDNPEIDPEMRKDAAWALAERRFDRAPAGWEPPPHLSDAAIAARGRVVASIALAALIAVAGVVTWHRAWGARDNNPSIAIQGWAAWNYSGYEEKAAYPQYHAIMTNMEQIADTAGLGPGRVLWEPSSGSTDAINSYGTSLALELLPYFTNGKIDSMEGIYFESSATTSYHFLTVAECAQNPSDPVRGLVYGSPSQKNADGSPGDDFGMCVRHLQDLGVRYLMLWTPESEALAAKSNELTFLRDIPGKIDGTKLNGWKVYEVANSDLVVGMKQEPVVLTHMKGGKYSQCWGKPYANTNETEPHLDAWECTTAPWWVDRQKIDTVYSQSGPSNWMRVDAKDLGTAQPRVVDQPATVSNVQRNYKEISFDVAPGDLGKPVEVKESFFPNWQVKGAKGPYRLAPNLMVVVPTSTHVTLTYGLTTADWLGRILTALGVVGLVLLALWKGARRYSAGANGNGGPADAEGPEAASPSDDLQWRHDLDPEGDSGDDDPDAGPPDRREAAPALP